MNRKVVASVLVVTLLVACSSAMAANSSYVWSNVTGSNPYSYDFTVYNTSTWDGDAVPLVVNWELPLFDFSAEAFADGGLGDAYISDINAPAGWEWEVLDNSKTPYTILATSSPQYTSGDVSLYYGNPEGPYGNYVWSWNPVDDPTPYDGAVEDWANPPFVLHWYTPAVDGVAQNPIPPASAPNGGSQSNGLGGFSFSSEYLSQPAPYQATWFLEPVTFGGAQVPGGDPLPSAPNDVASVPEPFTMITIFGGIAGVGAYIRKRRIV